MTRPEVPRSRLSIGIEWASRATTIGLEFALPMLGGVYLDRWLGTAPVLTLLLGALGFAAGMVHILRLARAGTGPGR